MLSWRLWLGILAMTVMQQVLHHAVGLTGFAVMVVNVAIGAWLGSLACRADLEERLERVQAEVRLAESWWRALHNEQVAQEARLLNPPTLAVVPKRVAHDRHH